MRFIFNLFLRLIKTVIKLSLFFAVFATIVVLIPNLPPYTKFTSIQLNPTQPRVGPLTPNSALNNAEKEYKGKLMGPEAFGVFNGELYTSLATGEIVKVSPGGHVTFVTKLGQPCSGLVKEHICGRPLGFQIDNEGKYIYVADAYHGIWKVDLKTDKKQLLVSPRVEIEKRKPMLFNSVALAKNGDLYWTDSTSDFSLKDGALSVLTDPSGRLMHYDAAKNTSKVLLDDLWFANGVVLSPSQDFVVVAETAKNRLVKYSLSGPKKGKSEVFVDGLPGFPDNVRALPDGSGILVALYTAFEEDEPVILRSLAPTPAVRKFLTRVQRLAEIPFEYLNNVYPHVVFEEIVYFIGHFKSVAGLTTGMSGLLQVDWDGNIVASYYNTDGSLKLISDAIVYNNKLYTGAPHLHDFIGSLPAPNLLKKAFEVTKNKETPKVEAKPQKPKPVETKPKPEEKPKVEKPKIEPKLKVEEKPKVVTKPKAEEKPKVEVKPKVEEKKEVPKVVKPAEAKPTQQAKPAEPVKPVQKPVENKKAESKVPTTPPPPAKSEPEKKQTVPKTTTAKPEVKTTSTPKPSEKSTTPPPTKTTTPKVSETPKKAKAPVNTPPPSAESNPKPIKEEIPSDTAKPPKETLKVIKKAGPTEIPVPKQ